MQAVVETPSYLADAEKIFSEDERRAVVDLLSTDPECGVLLSGGRGIRKFRFGFGGRGKSGGARIVYLFSGENVPIFLLAVFAKNEKANLSSAERNGLAALAIEIISRYRKRDQT